MRHNNCTELCPLNGELVRSNIIVVTPQTFPTAPTEKARPQKANPMVEQTEPETMPDPTALDLTVLCILDPSRRVKSRKDTADEVSWLTVTNLREEKVVAMLQCAGLKGYVFREPRTTTAVRIYDWVSITTRNAHRRLTWSSTGVRGVHLLPRRAKRTYRRIRDLGELRPRPS